MAASLDAVVVGSGPNGLAAAITLAQAGLSVHVVEAEPVIGGGARSSELTLPGFIHDRCSALHPFAFASPFFRTLPLHEHGLTWVRSDAALAHPLDADSAVFLEHSIERTAAQFDIDRQRYADLMVPAVNALSKIVDTSKLLSLANDPPAVARLALASVCSATGLLRGKFRSHPARALLAGMAAHSMLPLEKATTAGIAIALATAGHYGGWPFPRGGAQNLSNALANYLRAFGGTIETGFRVRDLRQLPPSRAILLDLSPREVLRVARDQVGPKFARVLEHYRYGMAAFKIDWALSDPVPWSCADVARAATVHLGGTFEEIAASERKTWNGGHPARAFVIVAQHSLFDPTRAPQGKHTLWAYCHVPNGSEVDMVSAVEHQIERFAPGFRDTILARSVMPPKVLEAHNANLVGGDILGGTQDVWQLLLRPSVRYYTTPAPNLYICSSSTPPGAGVHGLCGHFAARVALRRSFKLQAGEDRSSRL
jgi:phytoene dehydrogenase-like protein